MTVYLLSDDRVQKFFKNTVHFLDKTVNHNLLCVKK